MTQLSALPPSSEEQLRSYWDEPAFAGLRRSTWLRIGILALLLAALYWPNLRRLWLKTNPFTGEANWGHSFFVPLIGLYYLYLNREALLSPSRLKPLSDGTKVVAAWLLLNLCVGSIAFFAWAYYPSAFVEPKARLIAGGSLLGFAGFTLAVVLWIGSQRKSAARQALVDLAGRSAGWFGLYSLIWGLVFYAWSIWPGQNDLFKDFSMIATLFGVVLCLGGWGVMRTAWFPIFFLAAAFPWPQLLYSRIAMPLQELSAWSAVMTLKLTGVEAHKTGTKLVIALSDGGRRVLDVAEACAGIKSLMTFVAVGAAVGFLSSRAMWQRVLITLSAVPIAIFCNMIRVAGQGLLDYYVDQKLSQSFAHQFVGMVMLIPAFFLILLVGWVLDNIFIEEVDKKAVASEAEAARKASAGLVIEIPRPAAAPARPPAEAVAVSPILDPKNADLEAATRLLSARSRRKSDQERSQA